MHNPKTKMDDRELIQPVGYKPRSERIIELKVKLKLVDGFDLLIIKTRKGEISEIEEKINKLIIESDEKIKLKLEILNK